MVELQHLVEHAHVDRELTFLQFFVEHLLAFTAPLSALFFKHLLNARLSLCRGDEVYPFILRLLLFRSDNLHLVATFELVTQRHKFIIDLSANAVVAQISVYLEGEVEHRGAYWHFAHLAFRCENDNLRGEKVELEGVKEFK